MTTSISLLSLSLSGSISSALLSDISQAGGGSGSYSGRGLRIFLACSILVSPCASGAPTNSIDIVATEDFLDGETSVVRPPNLDSPNPWQHGTATPLRPHVAFSSPKNGYDRDDGYGDISITPLHLLFAALRKKSVHFPASTAW